MLVTDLDGRIVRVNRAFAQLVGRPRDELIGAPFSSVGSTDAVDSGASTEHDLISGAKDRVIYDTRYLRPDGSVVPVEVTVRCVKVPDGRTTCLLAQAVDITERERTKAEAEAERRRLEEAQRLAGMSSFELDPSTHEIHSSSERRKTMGLSTAFSLDDFTVERVHPDDREVMSSLLNTFLKERAPIEHVLRIIRPDGSIQWTQVRAEWMIGEDGRDKVVGTTLDVTALKNAEEALQFQGFHDSLTGLANRTLFLDRLGHALNQAVRRLDLPVVLLLDIDDFKDVNDSLGHAAGDQLLIEIAKRLASISRAGDTLARLGGDEFALLLEWGVMPPTARAIADRIARKLAAPFNAGDREITVSVSIGIALAQQAHETPEDLLRDADLAMYLAKQKGKARFEIARPGMQDEALEHLAITNDLRHALSANQFEIFYQPIVDAGSIGSIGAEALLRWHHPSRGVLLPGAFISVAESTGLIVPIGYWVLIEACKQAAAWRAEGVVGDDFYISVNLSPHQLAEPTLAAKVEEVLRNAGLPAKALVLEITEHSVMIDFETGLGRVRELKDLGIRIALDDYGTGYSSLNRLGKLPVDIVKIDKSFIDQLAFDREGQALVKSVIDVTQALGKTSVAEGVEQPDQLIALQALGCEYIQGYLIGMPAPASEAAATFRSIAAHSSKQKQADSRKLVGSSRQSRARAT